MNILQVTYMQKKVQAEQDRRYRMLVNLQRSDRPRYWKFLCVNCGSFIAELQGFEAIGLNDFYDPQNPQNASIGRHCKGTLPTGQACPYSYYFVLQ